VIAQEINVIAQEINVIAQEINVIAQEIGLKGMMMIIIEMLNVMTMIKVAIEGDLLLEIEEGQEAEIEDDQEAEIEDDQGVEIEEAEKEIDDNEKIADHVSKVKLYN
jgi:hypothetical protein